MNQEKIEELKAQIALMTAEIEGKKIEYKGIFVGDWEDKDIRDRWSFNVFEYRVKPESEDVPFDFETMPFPCVVQNIFCCNKDYLVVTKTLSGCVLVNAVGDNHFLTYQELSNLYKWRPLTGGEWELCRRKA